MKTEKENKKNYKKKENRNCKAESCIEELFILFFHEMREKELKKEREKKNFIRIIEQLFLFKESFLC